MEFDDIIVGAGSSDAVLAARLSEDKQRQVLLLEAGPDYPEIEKTSASLLDGRRPAQDHDWGLTAEMVPGRSQEYARGKVIGGCSAVNACLALRGTPADYDEWGTLGNPACEYQPHLHHDRGTCGRMDARRAGVILLIPGIQGWVQGACFSPGDPLSELLQRFVRIHGRKKEIIYSRKRWKLCYTTMDYG